MLKTKYLPKKHPKKAEIAARDEQAPETTKKDVPNAYRTRYCVNL